MVSLPSGVSAMLLNLSNRSWLQYYSLGMVRAHELKTGVQMLTDMDEPSSKRFERSVRMNTYRMKLSCIANNA